jgi:ABC-2 type transport system permease protein
MRGFKKFLKIELNIWIRTKENIFWAIVFPLFWFMLCRFTFPPLWGYTRVETLEYFFPSGIGIVILTSSFTCLTISIASSKERGILKRLTVTPVSVSTYMAVEVLTALLFTTFSLFLLSCIAACFGVRCHGSILSLLLLILLGMLTFMSIAFMIASISKNVRSAYILTMICTLLILFISEFFPMGISASPEWVQVLSEILPGTPVVHPLREIVMGQGTLVGNVKHIGILLGWLIGTAIVTAKTFRWK